MFAQYSDKTSKSKRVARLDELSSTIKWEVFYSKGELLCACLLGGFARIQIVDTESEAYVQESLSRLMHGRTTFVIAHRLSTIRKADQILVIENGRIVERGDHEALLEKEGRYFDLYNSQARILFCLININNIYTKYYL